jgi:hypothetical protein
MWWDSHRTAGEPVTQWFALPRARAWEQSEGCGRIRNTVIRPPTTRKRENVVERPEDRGRTNNTVVRPTTSASVGTARGLRVNQEHSDSPSHDSESKRENVGEQSEDRRRINNAVIRLSTRTRVGCGGAVGGTDGESITQ